VPYTLEQEGSPNTTKRELSQIDLQTNRLCSQTWEIHLGIYLRSRKYFLPGISHD